MKCKVLEIRWHDRTPIFSTDFHASPPTAHKKAHHPYAAGSGSGGVDSGLEDEAKRKEAEMEREEREKRWRLATCGADNNVRLWLVHPRPPVPLHPVASTSKPSKPSKPSKSDSNAAEPKDDPTDPKVEYLATLSQHQGVVNCVRFAPSGEMLASAGDDGNILIWVPGESSKKIGETEEDRLYEKESWRVKSMIRSMSGKEIYDLAWSPDGEKIIAGSVDHSATIYDVASGVPLARILDHSNYVQGVAWDPLEKYIATQSSDRSMHVYSYEKSATGLAVHPVGKTSRMEVQRRPAAPSRSSSLIRPEAKKPVSSSTDGAAKDPSPAPSTSKATDGDALMRPPMHQRSLSRASDSDRSEASSTAPSSLFSLPPSAAPKPDEITTAMDPPSSIPHHPRPSSHSRKSSSSNPNSAPSASPSLHPSSSRPLRSPSPAPLPAVMVPLSPKLNPVASSSSGTPSFNESVRTDTIRLYGDATMTHFFRRLAWSPDGGLLLTPAGLFEDPYAAVHAQASAAAVKKPAASGGSKGKDAPGPGAAKTDPKPTVYIYSRSNVARPPIAHLPGHKTTSIAIRFCPVLFDLRDSTGEDEDLGGGEGEEPAVSVKLSTEGVEVPLDGGKGKGKEVAKEDGKEGARPRSLFDLPYRMVYAVATQDSVYLYDTQQAGPIAMFGGLHFLPFTDLSWSADGQTLAMSSQDGYISVVAFDPGELGTPYHTQPSRAHPAHPHALHDPHAANTHHHSASSVAPAKPADPAPSSPAAAPAINVGALPALFAKVADAASSPAKPAAAPSTPAAPQVAGEKRDGDGEGTDGAPPAKKQKKRVAPTLVKPLGT
ncbi:hypothetical protein JCM10213_008493 [Rhodosporidiobolus nylandii]